jgi:hypothetical protein
MIKNTGSNDLRCEYTVFRLGKESCKAFSQKYFFFNLYRAIVRTFFS